MYIVNIDEELELDTYKKLIGFAFQKSDTFMLVTYRNNKDIESRFALADKSLYDSKEEYLVFLDIVEQRKKEAYEYQRIFKNNTEVFLEKLKPYLIKIRNHPTEWPSSKIAFLSNDSSVDICTYKICSEVKSYLLDVKGLFNWRHPYFPNDLCFFSKGYCWFYTVAHDRDATMYISDFNDVVKLRKLGLKFKLSECKDEEVILFHEDY
ncbi:hypothetical protein SH2C18_15120 [Clostridium sediminicola]|uniref:hypothetical protein n=1 Tax=Clostridium sediminicola TaxID=3114879 RepID=UPI0031F1F16A